jgi:hypothetical protein
VCFSKARCSTQETAMTTPASGFSSGNGGRVVQRGLSVAVMCVAMLLGACRDPYDADVDPGHKGEPGSALKQVYSKEFRVVEGDYFAALNDFYSFAHAQVFERIDFGDCFSRILDFVPDKEGMACIGVFAAKGAPTKAHMTFTILARALNRFDRNDHLTCRIDIYINDSYEPVRTIAPSFQERIDSRLQEFDRRVAGLGWCGAYG